MASSRRYVIIINFTFFLPINCAANSVDRGRASFHTAPWPPQFSEWWAGRWPFFSLLSCPPNPLPPLIPCFISQKRLLARFITSNCSFLQHLLSWGHFPPERALSSLVIQQHSGPTLHLLLSEEKRVQGMTHRSQSSGQGTLELALNTKVGMLAMCCHDTNNWQC